MKTQIFHDMKFDIRGHRKKLFLSCEKVLLCKKSFDLMTTLTYVLIDNFCPCFFLWLPKYIYTTFNGGYMNVSWRGLCSQNRRVSNLPPLLHKPLPLFSTTSEREHTVI